MPRKKRGANSASLKKPKEAKEPTVPVKERRWLTPVLALVLLAILTLLLNGLENVKEILASIH